MRPDNESVFIHKSMLWWTGAIWYDELVLDPS